MIDSLGLATIISLVTSGIILLLFPILIIITIKFIKNKNNKKYLALFVTLLILIVASIYWISIGTANDIAGNDYTNRFLSCECKKTIPELEQCYKRNNVEYKRVEDKLPDGTHVSLNITHNEPNPSLLLINTYLADRIKPIEFSSCQLPDFIE